MVNILKSELFGWPILADGYNFNAVQAIDRLIKLRLLDVRGFFDLYISTNPKDPASLILKVCLFFNFFIFELKKYFDFFFVVEI